MIHILGSKYGHSQFTTYFQTRKKGSPISRKAHKINIIFNYSMIVATRPEPTVRPPSRSDFAYLETCLFEDRWANGKCAGERYDTAKVKVHTKSYRVYLNSNLLSLQHLINLINPLRITAFE